jgi:16S rRNA (adenine1518-N6/adenine1519-N6)-dimethyltransferase
MQRLGQHFLKNKAVVKKIIAALELNPKEVLIEIGAGHGELTLPLAEACKKIGCKILAIEKDKALAENLEKRIRDLKLSGVVKIFPGDALRVLPNISKENLSQKIVGNIPYYITGRLLRIIGELKTKPELCVLMLQKEVAERICATPRIHPTHNFVMCGMNRLAAVVQFWAKPEILFRLSKKEFTPPPEVDSAAIKLSTRPIKKQGRAFTTIKTQLGYDHSKSSAGLAAGGAKGAAAAVSSKKYYETVRALFSQPRKTILNNLVQKSSAKISPNKTEIAEKLRKNGVDPGGRPQNLDIEDVIKISRLF